MTDRAPDIGIAIDTDTPASAVSWAAIIAGALVATAISLALIVLGAGLGFSIVSPWTAASASAATVAVSTVVWLVVMQWVSSGVGGYLTGRLRTRWTDVPSDEIFFRDTAHGFLAWAASTIVVATLTTSALSGILSTGAQVAGAVVGGAAQGASQGAVESAADPTDYFVDMLFRPPATEEPVAPPDAAAPPEATTPPATPQTAPPVSPSPNATEMAAAPSADRAEVMRILVRGLASEEFPAADERYLAQLVASETGMSEADAEARVAEVLQNIADTRAEAQQLADEARQATATLAVVLFVSLLVGAFIACVAAALGGRERDELSRSVFTG